MSMHIEGPWLSTTGKKKGKHKFRNADEAQKARGLDAEWKELQKRWGVEAEDKKRKRALTSEVWKPAPATHRGATEPKIASVDTGWAPCSKAPEKVYTGTEMLGIGQLHKSNAIPIFRQQDAEDLAKMRR
jgi:hypothetical protein